MTQEEKQKIKVAAEEVLAEKRQRITEEIKIIPQRLADLKTLNTGEAADELAYQSLVGMSRKRYEQLNLLYPSPYFNRLVVQIPDENQPREMFFGKFSFNEEKIYSWSSKAATVRFSEIGPVEMVNSEGKTVKAELLNKDQYLIVDGKIIFFAAEEIGRERELIYQEYFSNRKTEFALPEIVAQMEKAQDEVVRAEISGPLVIAGPAGSGKTTLALHRIAYLLQSPDTAEAYQPEKILVLVQDSATKNYFSQLLPSFGIKNVLITTFNEWAFDVLNLQGFNYQNRPLVKESDNDRLELAKLKALQSNRLAEVWKADIFSVLGDFYGQSFSPAEEKTFKWQRQEKILDRFDVTVLLKMKATSGQLEINRQYYQIGKDKSLANKVKRSAADYSLIIVDEFENYLPEQLQLIGQTLNKKKASILYVGDLSQQIFIGTIKHWQDLGESFIDRTEEKIIRLQKVYRNTKQILNYLSGLGYVVDIPDNLKSGPEVEEKYFTVLSSLMESVEDKLVDLAEVSVGIIVLDNQWLAVVKENFIGYGNVKVLPISEAQGVEFDTVFVIKSTTDNIVDDVENMNDEWLAERKKIVKDKLYVALTRAMNGLFVLNLEQP